MSDIQERLNLPVEELTRVLHSLSGTKNKVLLRVGDAKGAPTLRDTYKINTNFKATMRRVKVRPQHAPLACHRLVIGLGGLCAVISTADDQWQAYVVTLSWLSGLGGRGALVGRHKACSLPFALEMPPSPQQRGSLDGRL